MFQRFASVFLALVVVFSLTACVQQPIPFEEPEKHEFATIPPVSIRDPEEVDSPAKQEERTFVVRGPSGEICFLTKAFYGADGIVNRIYGEISFTDKSIADLETLKKDVQTMKNLIEEFDLSGMSISVDENETTYFETYDFLYLDQVPDNAYAAAAFIGFEAKNETISIEETSQALIGFGFTEE